MSSKRGTRNAERGTRESEGGSRNPKLETRCAQRVTALLDWFVAHARDLPWRRTLDPYEIWVSEIMLQQTQVKTVIPYFERWRRALPDIATLAAARPERVLKLWEGLGYYTRARNLQKAAQQIVADHRGQFPREFEAVLALPGIGRYTAGAIGSIAFNQPTPILDGNVIRVLTRLSGIRENPREKRTNAQLWQLAEELVTGAASHSPLLPINLATADVRRHALDPGADGADSRRRLRFRGSTGENFFGGSSIRNSESRTASAKSQAPIAIGRSPISNSQTPNAELRTPNTGLLFSGPCSALNQSLMELGATICLPRTPRCTECPLEKICVARRDDLTDQIPNLGPRPTATRRRFVAFVAQRHGRLLVRQRGPAELNGSLWEFPNLEAISETEPAAQLATRLFGTRVAPAPLCRINHSITRYRIELDAFTVTLDDTERKRLPPGRWIPLSKVDNLAFTSAHRKILTHFLRRVAPR